MTTRSTETDAAPAAHDGAGAADGRARLLARAAQAAGPEVPEHELAAFLARYYRYVADEDLLERDPVDVAGAALSHRAGAARRPAGTTLVRAITPGVDDDGWSVGHTVIEVVTDDMPFLVDSLNAELARLERSVHLFVHPALVVRRDAEGNLLAVLDATASALPTGGRDPAWPEDAGVESWMHVEVDRESDPDALEALAAALASVLGDVRAAVEDWSAMREAALGVAQEMAQRPPAGLEEQAGDVERLLRWLAADNFTFLGCREYALDVVDGEDVLRPVPGTGLGTLREDRSAERAARAGAQVGGGFARLPAQVRARARSREVLVLTKANSRSTVHRPAWLDYVGVKSFDAQGQVVGERRFLGLFASVAYTESVRRVPLLDAKAAAVMARSGFAPTSHSGKDLLNVLETYPRDELFQMGVGELYATAMSVVRLRERRRTRVFLRPDEYGRFVSVVVYLPRDRYTTAVRLRVQRVLEGAFGPVSVDHTAAVDESVLARLHFVLRVQRGRDLPEVDAAALERAVAEATRTWDEDLADALAAELGEEEAGRLSRTWGRAFPESYKEDFPARAAVGDLRRVDAVCAAAADAGDETSAERLLSTHLYHPMGAAEHERRLKVVRARPLSLTAVLPLLRNLGVEVVDERPYRLEGSADGATAWVYDFGLALPAGARAGTGEKLTQAFTAAWEARSESDALDRLVLLAALGWRQVTVLRACTKYLRQTGSTFSQDYLVDALVTNAPIAAALVALFEARFVPVGPTGPAGAASGGVAHEAVAAPAATAEALAQELRARLDEVVSLDHDRILRSYLDLVLATVRTSAYQVDERGEPRDHLALKIDPQMMPDLPAPRPSAEIWVYSPRVEGVHLRFGAVARGGLRWSDRREDFRTEVLGLVKAQTVKNAVIVPTGAKGGFYPKDLPDPAVDRDAWLAQGTAAYRTFVHALLDVTDDLVPDEAAPGGRRVVPPPRVVRHDGDDAYLVVAADKGTAAFSDTANAVAAEHGFWLGDAFASGGSAGYDHKAMGITARGAWTSVRHHFRELGTDPQSEPTTVVGVGDMSGDVFGNGMLLSEEIALVAAFDHRHVFLDPSPDVATSYAERRRLFALPRSSWADYDASLISAGGGVWPRTAKSVPISPQVAAALGMPAGTARATPAQVVRAALGAPVDLLWNGGIGTYVKASTETHAEVGDRANDAVRVDGRDLRARVVGEGGNLGLTQRGRVEAALAGVRLNTDAIDNSAGVDCSDHEVNIKIALADVVARGDLTTKQRDELLVAMTGDVAALVLADNEAQNELLVVARRQAPAMLAVHRRMIAAMEADGDLDRELEELPGEAEMDERAGAGVGLTVPELAVVTAYAKNTLADHLLATPLADDPAFAPLLAAYFPAALVERCGQGLAAHPLRREIVTTAVVNDMVNRCGATFVFRAVDETGASVEHVVRAWTVCRAVFDVAGHAAAVAALDEAGSGVERGTTTAMRLELRRLVDRATRWFVQHLRVGFDVAAEVERFAPVVARWSGRVGELLVGTEREAAEAARAALEAAGVPPDLAARSAGLLQQFPLLDVAEAAAALGVAADDAAPVYFEVAERYGEDALLDAITALPRGDRWQSLARAAMREDLYAVMAAITSAVLAGTAPGSPTERIAAWEDGHGQLERVRTTLAQVREQGGADLAPISVALRLLRSVVTTGA